MLPFPRRPLQYKDTVKFSSIKNAMDTLVKVGSYTQPYEAHIARNRLRDSGIPAFLRNEHTISIDWFLSNALGGVLLLVPADRAEEARAILSTDPAPEMDPVLEDPIFCPACGSPDTEPTQVRKFNAALPFALSGALFYFFGPEFIILVFPLFFGGPGVQCHTCEAKSYIGKWPLGRVAKVMGIGTAVFICLMLLQTVLMAWNKEFVFAERDWNQDGETTLGEYLESAFVVKVPNQRSGCFDYYQRITGAKLKTECDFDSGLRFD